MTTNFDKYDTAVNYLYSLQKHGIKLGLANTEKMMRILGNPHTSFRAVHIAGTNGKGSTSAAIASILQENGFKTGLFTSPHLVSFTERIRINNTRIEEAEVIKIASLVHDSIKRTDLTPTFFEFVTAMAFHYFSEKNVDWAVIETGMGGRLDATNIIKPEASVITNISLDHNEFLGGALADITREKAGIIKPGIPVITSSGKPEVTGQLSDIAEKRGSEIHVYGRDFKGSLLKMDAGHISFDYAGCNNYSGLSMPLTGRYQLYNGCAAVKTCEVLRERGVSISDNAVKKGLLNVRLEGRLECVSENPRVFVDGAHNPEAAESLADSIGELFPRKKVVLVTGIMADKDIRGILQPLTGISETVILTKPAYERAAPPERLMDDLLSLKKAGLDVPRLLLTAPTVAEALELAKKHCAEDNIILVTGSFYTIGEVKEIFGGRGIWSTLREGFAGSDN
ncbi:MAG: bifunctional folylpolyglutamate synthase/dihydrofolate synthase [Nitrospiraceae bacterium]|nr:MAG: bifunctional folylpolyglutamate synthase/dihydrofolate synthase [Nitrospiraceae bacterium]